MQVITWNDSTDNDGVAIYMFDDSKEIIREKDRTTINDSNGNPELIISDVNTSNSNVYQNAIEPDDYFGYKYSYNEADGWVAIPGWIDPRIELEENNGE
jgi:hypothetical protein